MNKRYGDFAALDDINFTVPSGSLTALLGPSGSGKSTLLRVIAGLDLPDSGTVTIDGRDVTRVPPQRRGIGFVFQHYAAFKHMTVRDNIAFGLKIRKRPKAEVNQKVDELLETVGLSGFQTRYPGQLSGGQRQRMALARALAVDPRVLLLDEPFGALDALTRMTLQDSLRQLIREERPTVLLVTHDVDEALFLADRILVFSPRPATVLREFTLNRHEKTHDLSEFAATRREILCLLGIHAEQDAFAKKLEDIAA